MQFITKLILTNLVIIGCAQLGRKFPSLAGLVATMPITTLAVLLWINAENSPDPTILTRYTRGVLWGILPTALFFGMALFCFKRGYSLPVALSCSFAVWLAAAAVHQWLLR